MRKNNKIDGNNHNNENLTNDIVNNSIKNKLLIIALDNVINALQLVRKRKLNSVKLPEQTQT